MGENSHTKKLLKVFGKFLVLLLHDPTCIYYYCLYVTKSNGKVDLRPVVPGTLWVGA